MTSPLAFAFRLICLALVLGTGLSFADRWLLAEPANEGIADTQLAQTSSNIQGSDPKYTAVIAREPGLTSVLTTSSNAFDMPVFDLASLSPGYRPSDAPIDPSAAARPKLGITSIPAMWLKFLPLPRRKPVYRSKRAPIYDWRQSQLSVLNTDAPAAAEYPAVYQRKSVIGYNQAGYEALGAGNSGTALEYFEKSLELDPNQPLINSQRGYIYKNQGRYKVASRAFDSAALGGMFMPRQPGLAREASYLSRPLRLSGYTVWRQGSRPEADISFGPSLAQSQSGLTATYRLPIDGWASRHELSAYTRLLWAYEPMSLRLNQQSYQSGLGIQVRPFSGINLITAAERLVSLGDQARDDWLLRASYSAGAGYAPLAGERSWLHWSVYADAAMIDPTNPDLQVIGEGRIGLGQRPFAASSFTAIPFAGFSANFQDAAGLTTSLYEASAGLWMRYWPGGAALPDPQRALDLRVEYRGKVAGDSASSSGVLLTLGVTY